MPRGKPKQVNFELRKNLRWTRSLNYPWLSGFNWMAEYLTLESVYIHEVKPPVLPKEGVKFH
jgi:hypothetical protein